mmetsp:Transcript_2077/g.3673  ORF Transcript_2077/g.3673 Transcript_2077/m.3673 type:complete len:194 (-) Transcript_2077:81-662(-)
MREQGVDPILDYLESSERKGESRNENYIPHLKSQIDLVKPFTKVKEPHVNQSLKALDRFRSINPSSLKLDTVQKERERGRSRHNHSHESLHRYLQRSVVGSSQDFRRSFELSRSPFTSLDNPETKQRKDFKGTNYIIEKHIQLRRQKTLAKSITIKQRILRLRTQIAGRERELGLNLRNLLPMKQAYVGGGTA